MGFRAPPSLEIGRRLLDETFPQYEPVAPIQPGSSVIIDLPIERVLTERL